MADILLIDIGSAPNDGQGDPLQEAFQKTNINFGTLNAAIANVAVDVVGATNVGTSGTGVYKTTVNKTLQFKKLVAGSGVEINDLGDTIGISSTVNLDLDGQQPGSFVTVNGQGGLTVSGILRFDPESEALISAADLNLTGSFIKNLANPTSSQDAATKAYVDSAVTNIGGGVTVLKDNVSFGLQTRLNFIGSGIDVTQTSLNTVAINVNQGTDIETVQTVVGEMFTNNLNEGIISTYSDDSKKVNISVNDFNIKLIGAVTGSVLVNSFKNDITIETSSTAISGLTIKKDASIVGGISTVKTLNFSGSNIILTRDGDEVSIQVAEGLTNTDVRNEIGATVKGVVSDPLNPAIETESGITTRYVPNNNTLELGVRSFNIALVGAVTGNATVSRLRDVTIATTSNFIEGLTLRKDGSQIGATNSLREFNFVGDNITVQRSGNVANISISSNITGDQVSDVLNPRMLGNQDGLSITYDSLNKFYKYRLNPITINLTGAVAGTGVVTFDGSAVNGNVTINTTGGGGGGGITVADEGNVSGQASVINFVGGGITTAVSLDGTTATVYVPNSPAAEPFITAVQGSENVPNARKLTAGTGVAIVDEGPGGNIIISANNDAILAKSAYALNGVMIAEQFGINFKGTQYIKPFLENDVANNRVNLTIYELRDAWYRTSYDAGTVTDNQGPILDFGPVIGGIIEVAADLGTLN